MAKLIDETGAANLAEQFDTVDVGNILNEISEWKDELDDSLESNVRRDVLDTVEDLIIDNCY